jgi:hypothetical protein
MPRNAALYDEDFFAWTEEQARLLRSGELSQLDLDNVAEEIESMGKSLRRELRNRLVVLIAHLLKWRYQPGFRSNSWSATIREQRRQITDLIEESPSLRPILAQDTDRLYLAGRDKAANETGLSEAIFPVECPFTPEQLLAENFRPEG